MKVCINLRTAGATQVHLLWNFVVLLYPRTRPHERLTKYLILSAYYSNATNQLPAKLRPIKILIIQQHWQLRIK